MCAILKIVKSWYLNEKVSDFDGIKYTAAYLELDESDVTVNELKLTRSTAVAERLRDASYH